MEPAEDNLNRRSRDSKTICVLVRFRRTGHATTTAGWPGSAPRRTARVGISRTTGEVTHVTAPDVDAERDCLFQCLAKSGDLAEKMVVPDFHEIRKAETAAAIPGARMAICGPA
jgi:LssY C-terminus